MKQYLLLGVLSYVAVLVCSTEYEEVAQAEWENFKLKHGKVYDNEIEEIFRSKVFLSNKLKIAQHNQKYEKGLTKFRLEMNHFGDMLFHEFRATMNGFKRNYRERLFNGSLYLSPANVVLPQEVDWRKEGYVTPVKNQGQCGSCWAFSTTGSLEGQHFRKTGQLVSLSEQNLVDCSTGYGNNGCQGGLMDQAFQYIKDNHGVDTEEAYPYVGKMHKKCRFNKKHVGATDTGFVDVTSGDESALKEAVATVGPVSVAIDANHEEFMFYKEGVYDNVNCSSEELDHGVLVVGYGTTEEGEDYWIVKNSWGTTWGEEGYVRMSRNKKNQCGIATSASYPLV